MLLFQHLTLRCMFDNECMASLLTAVVTWIPYECSRINSRLWNGLLWNGQSWNDKSWTARSIDALQHKKMEARLVSSTSRRGAVDYLSSTRGTLECREMSCTIFTEPVLGLSGGRGDSSCLCFQYEGMTVRGHQHWHPAFSVGSVTCNIRWASGLFTNFLTGRERALVGVGTLVHSLFPRSVFTSIAWSGCFDIWVPLSSPY
jgi:hypothetical protein